MSKQLMGAGIAIFAVVLTAVFVALERSGDPLTPIVIIYIGPGCLALFVAVGVFRRSLTTDESFGVLAGFCAVMWSAGLLILLASSTVPLYAGYLAAPLVFIMAAFGAFATALGAAAGRMVRALWEGLGARRGLGERG